MVQSSTTSKLPHVLEPARPTTQTDLLAGNHKCLEAMFNLVVNFLTGLLWHPVRIHFMEKDSYSVILSKFELLRPVRLLSPQAFGDLSAMSLNLSAFLLDILHSHP